MGDREIVDLLTWLEPQHLPFLNLFQHPKETAYGTTETTENADTKDATEAAPASRWTRKDRQRTR